MIAVEVTGWRGATKAHSQQRRRNDAVGSCETLVGRRGRNRVEVRAM